MSAAQRTPSSGTAGFFQSPPSVANAFNDDVILQSIHAFYTSNSDHLKQETGQALSQFGKRVLQPDVYEYIAEGERNIPFLTTHTTFGKPNSQLHTSHGWKQLQTIGIQEGMVAIPYEPAYGHLARVHHFLKYHIWTPSALTVTCPSAMTDGAACLFKKHLSSASPELRPVLGEVYRRLTSRDPSEAWTSGQWMTERAGGSDVRGTETLANQISCSPNEFDAHGMPLGDWSIDGFKWFSSATDSQMSVLLAQTQSGLSAFYAPMRRKAADGTIEMNGVSIQRLKPKLGTKALPTAELVLTGMRGYLIGKEGQGVKEISAILNITRIHNAISALGFLGRGLAISRAHARVRKVEGKLLRDIPAHVRTMAANQLSYAAHMQLGFFCVALLGITERPESFEPSLVKDVGQASALLRLLTPVAKAQCSKTAVHGLQECMESLGGIGYLEDEQEFNIARLSRDSNVLCIWEGTTDVMASDVVRVMKGRDGGKTQDALCDWVGAKTSQWPAKWAAASELIHSELGFLTKRWTSYSTESLKAVGRELLLSLAWISAAVLLVETTRMKDAGQYSDIGDDLARRWIATKKGNEQLSEDSLKRDQNIVFTMDDLPGRMANL